MRNVIMMKSRTLTIRISSLDNRFNGTVTSYGKIGEWKYIISNGKG